jgi:hypothetical protein
MKVTWGLACVGLLLLVATPAAAATGACWSASDEWFESPEQGGGICIDDVPEAACDLLAAEAETGVAIEFNEGETCEDVADQLGHGPWDGLCVFYIDFLEQDVCAWIGVEPGVSGGVTVQDFCEDEEWELDGEWLGESRTCPWGTAIKVPAVPGPALLALAFVLMIGGLVIVWRMRRLAI